MKGGAQALISELSNGNFGAANVLTDLLYKENAVAILQFLKEFN